MKRAVALFLCLVMCLSLFPTRAFAEEVAIDSKAVDILQTSVPESYEEPENESVEKPTAETRIISTEEELAELAELVNAGNEAAANGSYRLMDDLYLSGAFTPIGTAEHPFKGSFDGDGKKIRGLSAAGGTGSFGLFGVTENARLKRIAIENATVSADGYTAVGAIVGTMQGGTLTESYVTGALSSSTAVVGGLVGILDGGTVENCYNTAEVNGYDTAGGVVGWASNGAVINCCYGSGWTDTAVWKKRVGYVVGYTENASVVSSYALNGADYHGYIIRDEAAYYESSYAGFDFSSVWTLSGSAPLLLNNMGQAGEPMLSAAISSGTKYRALLIGQQSYGGEQTRPGRATANYMQTALENSNDNWAITNQCDVSKSGVESLISSTFGAADSDDINLFYFCGHGAPFFIAGMAGDLSMFDGSHITTDELSYALNAQKGHFYVIIDTCGSGAVIANSLSGNDAQSFNNGLISAFAELDERTIYASSGELRTSKFSVLTACNFNENSWYTLITSDHTRGYAHFTSYLTEAAGFPISEGDSDYIQRITETMPGDANGDRMLTFQEAYTYSYNKSISAGTDTIAHVQMYPSNCSDVLFNRTGLPSYVPKAGEYITFSSPTAFSVSLSSSSGGSRAVGWDGTLYCSTNKADWNEWWGEPIDAQYSFADGKYYLYLNGKGNSVISANTPGFTITGSNVSCSGNIMMLLCYPEVTQGMTVYMGERCFWGLFSDCTALVSAPSLPATVLAPGCYAHMFSGCTGLTKVPSLPATTLAANCYQYMFFGCTGIKLCSPTYGEGPNWSIPAGAVAAENWNQDMFRNSGGSFTGNPVIGKVYYYVQSSAVIASGTCGDNLTWTLDDAGTLTISGTGAMTKYSYLSAPLVPWYSNKSSIKKVVINSGVTTIGDYAFDGCSNLASVTIPNSVTGIGGSAFFGCTKLVTAGPIGGEYNVQIGWEKTIPSYAFSYYSHLTNVTIPESVTSIGDYAFHWCSGLTNVTIPNSVTSIGDYAFEYCSSLTSVTIGNSVTTIGDYAFSDCQSLSKITIPNSVTTIGENAFSYCINLNEIIIPNSVTTIGDSAFSVCQSLTEIAIPDSVTTIGENAFNCSSLIAINVSANNEKFSSQKGVLFNKDKSILILFPKGRSGEYTVPDSVISIGDEAFSFCMCLTSVTIPDSVITIGNGAFANEPTCSSLTNITIGSSVTTIGDSAFSGNDKLTNITIPNSVTMIGNYAFVGCNSLTEVIIPNSVTAIGEGAFEFCYGLTEITIPNSVKTISVSTFYFCDNLTEITIPSSVTTIEDGAFYDCGNLTDVYYTGSEDQWIEIQIGQYNECLVSAAKHFNYSPYVASGKCGDDLTWTLDEDGTLTISGTGVMSNWSFQSSPFYTYRGSIKSVDIQTGVTSIGDYAFCDCNSLTDVTIPDSITVIGDYAFSICSSLTGVTIPDSVTLIDEGAFSNCGSLTSVTIPDSMTSICNYTFSNCYNLTDLTIANSVTNIGREAFSFCGSLSSVMIPDSVTVIGEGAFANCYRLSSVTIPKSVTSIGDSAFNVCNSLTDVYCSGSEAEWNRITIGDGNEALTKAAKHFECTAVLTLPAALTKIEAEAFTGVPAKVIVIPATVTEIGSRAFADCPNLRRVIFQGTPTVIAEDYLEGCGDVQVIYA